MVFNGVAFSRCQYNLNGAWLSLCILRSSWSLFSHKPIPFTSDSQFVLILNYRYSARSYYFCKAFKQFYYDQRRKLDSPFGTGFRNCMKSGNIASSSSEYAKRQENKSSKI